MALRDRSCHNEQLVEDLGVWLGWALSLRVLSALWDIFITILLFKGFGFCCDITDHEIADDKTEYIQQVRRRP